MKAILQRVTRASVTVDGKVVGAIEQGLLILVGVTHTDTSKEADWLARKIATLRVFRSADGPSHFDRSLLEIGGAALVVSQFTLYGDARKGRRPDFTHAARPEVASPLIDTFCALLRAQGVPVQTGIFGADMLVELANDGPVTIEIETGN
ncbi:MAG TPA: D-aminoacyl-tRNA deacylase [Anaerolineae bacterium]